MGHVSVMLRYDSPENPLENPVVNPMGQVKQAKKKRAKDDASVDAVGEIFRSCPLGRGRSGRAYGRLGGHFRISPAKQYGFV